MKLTFAPFAMAALSVANPIPDATASGPSSFKITNIISGGTGCPQGSIDIAYTDNAVLPICNYALKTLVRITANKEFRLRLKFYSFSGAQS